MTLNKLALLALIACVAAFSSDRVKRSPAAQHVLDTTWLTASQKSEIESANDAASVNKKFLQYYKTLNHDDQKSHGDKIVKKCYAWLKEVATKEEIDELQKLHHVNHEKCKSKVREFMDRLPSAEKKAIALHLDACEAVWYSQHDHSGHGHHHRMRRDHHHGHGHTLEDYLKTHLSWLTESQGQELRDLKTAGKSPADIQAKVLEFYDSATGEVKDKATELLQGGCREVLQHVVGEDKAAELKALKESGASSSDIIAKIEALIGDVTDEHKTKLATTYGGACKKVFNVVSSRLRRHEGHAEHDLEHFTKEHLTWLTSEQKAEVLKLKGDKAAIKAKVNEYLDAATGETKVKAVEDLKSACKHLLSHVLGDKASEIGKLKESGATPDQIKAKIEELVAAVSDESLKALAAEHREDCYKIFKGASRKRRDHDHKLADFAEKYLTWLTPEQKAEVLALEGEGKLAVKAKVGALYAAADGETKEKATASFQSACRNHLVHVVGEEKAAELKSLKESGASTEDLLKKADELVAAITDPELKKEADEHREDCLKIFGVTQRTRRHHGRPQDHGLERRSRRDHHHGHGHTLDDYLKTHLSWLTESQGQELRDLKTAGKSPADIQAKVLEFYDSATGEVKDKATELLQGGCREVLQHVVGEDKAAELKALKESGASSSDIIAKIEALIGDVTDEHKKKLATTYGGACKKVFNVVSSRLRRHEGHDDHNLEHFAKEHLTWLTSEQKAEVLKLKDDKAAIKAKVKEFLHAASGETKVKAINDLQDACKHVLRHVLGDKAGEVKQLRESGASNDEVKAKVDELIGQVTDPHLKEDASEYKEDCYKLFASAPSRMRRHEGKTDLEDFVDNHLTWLNTEQKSTIQALKEANDVVGVRSKVSEYYAAATGETKETATHELQGACRELISDVLGGKANEIKTLKESGASKEDIAAKVDELIAGVTDSAKKAKALENVEGCKRLFGVGARKRRAFAPVVTHLDFMKVIVNPDNLLEDEELASAIEKVYDAADLNELAQKTVIECHSLYGEIVKIESVLNEDSSLMLIDALRTASNRQLKGIQAVTDICKATIDEIRENNGESGSLDDTLTTRLDELDDAESIKRVWKEKCIDWITDVTSLKEQDELKYLLQKRQRKVVAEKISSFMSRFDEPTRKQIGHMRPVCERLLFN